MNNKIQKGSGGLLVVISIISIAILGGFGWYLYTNKIQQKTTTQVVQITPQTSEKNVLKIGETIDEDGLLADTKEFQPFIDYLVSKLAAQGFPYTKGEFVGVTSVAEMAQFVREGKINIIIDSAFPVYVVDK